MIYSPACILCVQAGLFGYIDFDEHRSLLNPGDVLFLNWESINKDNAVMIRDNEQNRTLYELIRKTKVEQHLPVVVIIDEEHQFAGQNAKSWLRHTRSMVSILCCSFSCLMIRVKLCRQVTRR